MCVINSAMHTFASFARPIFADILKNNFLHKKCNTSVTTQHLTTWLRDHSHLPRYPLLAYVGPMASDLTESPLHSGTLAAHSVGITLAQTPLRPQTFSEHKDKLEEMCAEVQKCVKTAVASGLPGH